MIWARQDAIAPSAPDVFLSPKDALEWVVMEGKQMAEEMDRKGELEALLDSHANREEYEKHGV